MKLNEWYRIIAGEDNLSAIPDAISYFESELIEAKEELLLKGNIEKINNVLPGIVEHRFNQLQEINAILEYIEIKHYKEKTKQFKRYLEHYNRSLSSRDAEKYAEAEDSVISLALLKNEISLVRNNFMGVLKALEQMSYAVSNVVKLRCAGLEDINL